MDIVKLLQDAGPYAIAVIEAIALVWVSKQWLRERELARMDQKACEENKTAALETLRKESIAHEDEAIAKEQDRYERVITTLQTQLSQADARTLDVQAQANERIQELLVEQTKMVEKFTRSAEELAVSVSTQIRKVVTVLEKLDE